MKLAAHLTSSMAIAIVLTTPLVACVTDTNRCLPGYRYAPEYDACLQVGGAPEAGPGAPTTLSDAGSEASVANDSGLGNACHASSDCTGRAAYCLKDPTAPPTDPGICTIARCTAADCTSAYSCCDCSAAVITSLMAWPSGVCAPSANKSALTSFGCTCL